MRTGSAFGTAARLGGRGPTAGHTTEQVPRGFRHSGRGGLQTQEQMPRCIGLVALWSEYSNQARADLARLPVVLALTVRSSSVHAIMRPGHVSVMACTRARAYMPVRTVRNQISHAALYERWKLTGLLKGVLNETTTGPRPPKQCTSMRSDLRPHTRPRLAVARWVVV